MGVISPLLPDKYSPLQENGKGNQGVYLTSVPFELAKVILNLIGKEAELIVANFSAEEIEENKVLEIEKEIQQNTSLQSTEKTQLSKSRRGQGIFRTNLERIEKSCRLTGLDAKEHLVASHIKPWRDCTNFERLDGYNGLLLSPHIDRLFDKGYISFNDNGDLIVSKLTNQDVLKKWQINSIKNVGSFNEKQKSYLQYHREHIFKD
jgi:predicted restriction endonuclease